MFLPEVYSMVSRELLRDHSKFFINSITPIIFLRLFVREFRSEFGKYIMTHKKTVKNCFLFYYKKFIIITWKFFWNHVVCDKNILDRTANRVISTVSRFVVHPVYRGWVFVWIETRPTIAPRCALYEREVGGGSRSSRGPYRAHPWLCVTPMCLPHKNRTRVPCHSSMYFRFDEQRPDARSFDRKGCVDAESNGGRCWIREKTTQTLTLETLTWI